MVAPIRPALVERLPEADRPAILDHLRCLAAMAPQKRAAILTLGRA